VSCGRRGDSRDSRTALSAAARAGPESAAGIVRGRRPASPQRRTWFFTPARGVPRLAPLAPMPPIEAPAPAIVRAPTGEALRVRSEEGGDVVGSEC